jgi:hypothetical protein
MTREGQKLPNVSQEGAESGFEPRPMGPLKPKHQSRLSIGQWVYEPLEKHACVIWPSLLTVWTRVTLWGMGRKLGCDVWELNPGSQPLPPMSHPMWWAELGGTASWSPWRHRVARGC